VDELDVDRTALLATFGPEATDLLDDMERHLLALEAAPGDHASLHALFRAAHTLKGGAHMVGLDAARGLAHAAEDLLERWRDGALTEAAHLVGLLLASVDALRRAVADGVAGRATDEARPALLAARLREAAAGHRVAAAEGEGGPGQAAGPASAARTLRVEVGKLDRLLDLTGEIAIARGQLSDLLERPGPCDPEALREAHREADRVFLELQELVMKARMVPLGPLFQQHQRTVRDAGAALGRPARLVVEGADVEVDTAVVEGIRDPVGHMIRNAVAHGLEPAAGRAAAGKPAVGTVTLRAFQDGAGIVVQVADDGRGVDRARVAEKAAALGLVSDPSRVSDAEAAHLLFEPGLTTCDEASDLAGRGVGMDVVRRNVEALRGSVSVESAAGRGTTVSLRLPLTLAIIQGFRVEVGGEVLVVPLDAVAECLDLAAEDAPDPAAEAGVMALRGAPLPYLRLRRHLGLAGPPPRREAVVVVGQGGFRAGLAVDRLLGEAQVVIKPLPRTLRGQAALSGSAILGDGRVALILDVPALLRAALRRGTEGTALPA
jgi:two-component system chemotaxis sensor kinase CheA